MPREAAFSAHRRAVEAGGRRMEYTLTGAVSGGVLFYGIEVRMTAGETVERAELCELTSDRELAVAILEAMCRGTVTPCAAAGVAEDMLAESAMR